ncbi:MAG: 2-amino-4-hydroxy-6-hydroxymethyldihydropteridine diphosphokinase [Mediterranea sp.]|jgi:2-amino-4-hydroxy-6-hydroxymethyldihydropteridine diphosphokinase|nr:2-amino-4-hydroxy-6-hydroxymethyldihydropteridine diphosphokinase [Mediterranea sp.]
MHVYLGLGTNLGDKEQNLRTAATHIEERIGKLVSLSAFYATEPWGFTSSHSFLNAALCIDTGLPPLDILHLTQSIEQEMGRTCKSVNGQYHDRIIDIDLLLCGNLVLHTPRLTLPHPLMHQRLFVMKPLSEIAPDVVHPTLQRTLRELCEAIKE